MTIRAPITIGGMAQLNNSPRRNKFITTDDLATITTAGYLSNTVNTILPTDIFDIFYNYVDENNVGTYEEFTVTISNGVVTLVAAAAGTIPDGSITTAKLADLAVTTAKLANLAVITSKLAASSVTYAVMQPNPGNSVTGRSASTTGDVSSIAVSADDQVLRATGTGGVRTIGFGTIATAGIADAAVTLAKLSAGIAPAAICGARGKFVSTGGSATVTITGAAVSSTDIINANIESSANAVSIQKVTPSAGSITVLCSGDPGNPNTIAWTAFRTAT